jgi:anti-sigma B factor antagonist
MNIGLILRLAGWPNQVPSICHKRELILSFRHPRPGDTVIMADQLLTHHEGKVLFIEVGTPSLMDPADLEELAGQLYHRIDVEDNRRIVLDFRRVEYISSQAIGILMSLHKKIAGLKGTLILCGVNARLTQLLQITRLDKVLKVMPSQKEAAFHMKNAML